MAAVGRVCASAIWRQQLAPIALHTRSFATLKDISIRLKSVKNIQKITKSMKMVAAAKYSRAERELKPARAYGGGASAVINKVELVPQDTTAERKPQHLLICMTSDRGLCGSIHSSIARNLRNMFNEGSLPADTKLVLVGDKLRSILQRTHRNNILMTFKDIGRLPPVFSEASFIASEVLNSDYQFESLEIIFNSFKSVVSFRTTMQPFVSLKTMLESPAMAIYDDCDAEVIQSYHEMTLANLIYYGLKEGACSEHSSRMTAMDAASKNANEMIDKLTLTYNRTRQAVITRELIEIISGAAAL